MMLQYFGTLIWDDIIQYFGDENLLWFLTEKKNCFGPIRSLFKKSMIYLIFIPNFCYKYHPKIMYEIIVPKDMDKSVVAKWWKITYYHFLMNDGLEEFLTRHWKVWSLFLEWYRYGSFWKNVSGNSMVRFLLNQIQVDNFQNDSFCYHFINEFEQKFYMTVLLCTISVQILWWNT